MIRKVHLNDAPQIADIYNFYINQTIITFEETPVDSEAIAERIRKITGKGYPYLVYEQEGKVIGYAYVNNWRERVAYDITLETSVYLEQSDLHHGIGRQLYAALIDASRTIGIHSLIGVISLPNEPSRRLHEYFKFELVGNFRESGKKFGRLIDVEFWQLIL